MRMGKSNRVEHAWRKGADWSTIMKTMTIWKLSRIWLIALVSIVNAGGQEAANSISSDPASTNQEPVAVAADGFTNAPSPEAAEQQLENAPGEAASRGASPPVTVPVSGPAAEVVRLAQAGVDENVMLSFVTNSPNTFDLSADAIVYLNDLGVS